jgi:hypothetical protein
MVRRVLPHARVIGRFQAESWSSPVRIPPNYPDAVTLLPGITVDEVLPGIDMGEGCSVKDSFACLDLDAAGFPPLFRAEWLVREPPEAGVPSARGWSAVPLTSDFVSGRQLGRVA